MTNRERKYFNDRKYCRKEYLGKLIKTKLVPFQGYFLDIPIIFEDIPPRKEHNGIITKIRRTGHSTTLTVSPQKTQP